MGDKLLIRTFDVEVGDCIYIRIPEGPDGFHILIDCGSKGRIALLQRAIKQLRSILPRGSSRNRRRLDLIIVTHRHADHIKGFDPDFFKTIEIGNIWLSAGMNAEHPQAERTFALHDNVRGMVQDMVHQNIALGPVEEDLLSLYGIGNDGAVEALKEIMPNRNNIQPTYVHAGMSSKDDPIKLSLKDTVLHILAPEEDIDGFYLGKEADESLRQLEEFSTLFADTATTDPNNQPTNVSLADFQKLQSRMLSNPLAFAESDSSIQNNLSVVLLIEWKGRRLLFVGDAEWEGVFKEEKHNGSWETMWNRRRDLLGQPIDFLKVGHHGSKNSSPWNPNKDETYEVNQILDAILPLPADGEQPRAQAIVSTMRKPYKSIPSATLLAELGRRVYNVRNYKQALEAAGYDPTELPHFNQYEAHSIDQPQPLRTDLERILDGQGFVDIEIDPL
ncbi:MAG: MBL fold metallo-hydrolase [Bacteroidota bacterium]